jgi:hypothetical protein
MKKRQMTDRLQCNPHPDAPHGFMRDASHNADRYVCECENWEPKPVAHVYRIEPNGRPCVAWDNASEIKVGAKLYAAPPKRDLTCVCGAVWEGEQMVHAPRKREWVGLTDEEVSYCRYAATFCDELDTAYMAELIEQALKEKNT